MLSKTNRDVMMNCNTDFNLNDHGYNNFPRSLTKHDKQLLSSVCFNFLYPWCQNELSPIDLKSSLELVFAIV
jgi:hypothetical protein